MIVVVAFVDMSAGVLYRSGLERRDEGGRPAAAARGCVERRDGADVDASGSIAPPIGGALFQLARGSAVRRRRGLVRLLDGVAPPDADAVPGEAGAGRADAVSGKGVAYFWSIPFLRTTIGMIAASNLVAVGAADRRDHPRPSTRASSGFTIGLFVALQGVALLAGSTVSPLLRRIFPMRAILLSEFWMALVYGAFLVYPSVYVLAACARAPRVLVPEHRLGDRRRTRTRSSPTGYSDVRWRPRTPCVPQRRRSGRSSRGCCSRTRRRGSACFVARRSGRRRRRPRDSELGAARPT